MKLKRVEYLDVMTCHKEDTVGRAWHRPTKTKKKSSSGARSGRCRTYFVGPKLVAHL